MSDQFESGWKVYSLATAAENKEIGNPICEVNLTELNNFYDKEISSKGERESFDYVDGQGNKQSGTRTTSQSVPAVWRPSEDNRITPPDVRRGEELIIWKYGDTDQLFWQPRNIDRHRRKLETVTHAYSGTTNEDDDTVTADNHYITEVSTHKGHVIISTSSANGEECKWNFQIRGRDGVFLIGNDNNDEFLIDKVNGTIRVINSFDSVVELVKKDARTRCAGNATLDADGNVLVRAGKSATVKAPSIVLDGEVECTKGLKVALGVSGGGDATFTGGVTAKTGNFPGGHGPH